MHPQQRYTLFEILTSTTNKLEKLFFEKGYEKLVRLENGYYICTPQNMGSSLKDWLGKEGKLKRNFQKKNFKIFLPDINKFFTFAPALRNKRH